MVSDGRLTGSSFSWVAVGTRVGWNVFLVTRIRRGTRQGGCQVTAESGLGSSVPRLASDRGLREVHGALGSSRRDPGGSGPLGANVQMFQY